MNHAIPDDDSLRTINSLAYDRMARCEHVLATPASSDELRRPLEIVDGVGWLGGDIRGWKVLCLAAAGGRHSALYNAAGAEVTVVDISDGMLELDRRVSIASRFNVRLIQASMLNMPMLQDGEFDLVIHPVSTCYVRDVGIVFREVARVLRPGGLYVSQHKQPINLQSSLKTHHGRYTIDIPVGHAARAIPSNESSQLREPNTTEIAHSCQSILGGICRAGMVIEDFIEPNHAKEPSRVDTLEHRSRFIPPYMRIKARKRTSYGDAQPKLILVHPS